MDQKNVTSGEKNIRYQEEFEKAHNMSEGEYKIKLCESMPTNSDGSYSRTGPCAFMNTTPRGDTTPFGNTTAAIDHCNIFATTYNMFINDKILMFLSFVLLVVIVLCIWVQFWYKRKRKNRNTVNEIEMCDFGETSGKNAVNDDDYP